ncbi:hypothetical protein FRB98_008161 [Tulasnella sp. 332]|nr:hypothetical protein FRB98_008161 [Tulasnella sp. 332]
MLSIRPIDGYGHAGASAAPLKTPGRSRMATAHPRTMMKENATTRQQLLTQTGKPGRVVYPFTPKPKGSSSYDSDHHAFDDRILATAVKASTSYAAPRMMVLLDKTNRTPFPSRNQFPVTPLPSGKLQLGLTPRLSLEAPPTIMRPSSARKSLRAPRSSTASNFETPEARGRRPHWDVSDGDISVEIATSSTSLEHVSIVEEDDDEIEYMPPSVPEYEYDCPFDMPDYRAIGSALMELSRRPVLMSGGWKTEAPQAELLDDEPRAEAPDDEDAPFPKRPPPPTKVVPSAPTRLTAGRLVPRPKTTMQTLQRPATAASRVPSRLNAAPASRTSTTMSNRTQPASRLARPSTAPTAGTRAVDPSKPRITQPITAGRATKIAPPPGLRRAPPPAAGRQPGTAVLVGDVTPARIVLGEDNPDVDPLEPDSFLFVL